MKLTMEQYGYQAYFQNEARSQINQIVFSNSAWGSKESTAIERTYPFLTIDFIGRLCHFENSFLEHHEYHPKNLRKKCREICESGLVSILLASFLYDLGCNRISNLKRLQS